MKLLERNQKNIGRLLIIIIVLMIALPFNYIMNKCFIKPIYESSAVLMLYNPLDKAMDIDLPKLSATYRVIATGNDIASGIIGDLNLDYTPEKLKSMITVYYEEDTGLMYIKARNNDAILAKKIVDSLVNKLELKVEKLFGEDTLGIADGPYIPTKALWPNIKLNMLISFVIGIFLSAMIIVWGERRR